MYRIFMKINFISENKFYKFLDLLNFWKILFYEKDFLGLD